MRNQFSLYGFVLTCFMLFITPTAYAGYVVDMIIFEPTSTDGWLDEYWPMLPAKLDAQDKDRTLGGSDSNSHHLLGEGSYSLNDVAKRLTSSGEYRIVAHTAWSQPTEERDSAINTVLPDGITSTGLPLQAKVKLYKQKFEHLDLEIQLERQIPKGVLDAFAQKHKLSLTDVGNTWRFRLQDSRKIKPGELQYFDHPMFGVLLMVRVGG